MASLTDIMPIVVKVDVRGTEIEVTGLATKAIAELLTRFSTLRTLFDRAVTGGVVGVDAKSLYAETPEAVTEIIVSGVVDKSPGRDKLIATVESLTILDQLALLRGVLEATMPNGLGPFVDAVVSTLGGSWGKPKKATEEEIPGLTVLDPSSPPPLSAALVVDTTGMTPSPSHRGNSSVSAN